MKQKAEKKTPLKVLYLENSPQDIEIIRELLVEANYDLTMEYTDNEKELIYLISENRFDIILSDFNLPGFDALTALRLHNEICPEVPFICISGSIGEETAIELIKRGAVDYVLKDRLVRFPSALIRVIDELKDKNARQRAEEALHESEQRFQVLAENSLVGIFQTDVNGAAVYVNP